MKINKKIVAPTAIGFLLILLILFFFLFFRQKSGLSQNPADLDAINSGGFSGLQQSGLAVLSDADLQNRFGTELQNALEAELQNLSQAGLQNLSQAELQNLSQAGLQNLSQAGLQNLSQTELLNLLRGEQSETGVLNLSQAEIELQYSMQTGQSESTLLYSQSGSIEINPNMPLLSIASLTDDVFLKLNPDEDNISQANREGEITVPEPVIIPVPDYMVLVRRGAFEMGSPETEIEHEEDEQLHKVIIRSFYISKFEVTQRQYHEVMGNNPSYFKGANLPVENVSWFDAVEYCNALSIRDGLPPAYTILEYNENRVVVWNRDSKGYRLPTEAEWEFSCRAGTTTAFSMGNNINRRYANYLGRGTRNVGSYPPNGWGIYDMHGNVSEWCWDWYYDYSTTTLLDTSFANTDGHRIFRGGNWFSSSIRLRSAFREHYYPAYRNMSIGFRIARNLE
ncbi:MAG: formylglycine-generating enzyme family protein [Treponema sp.]|nr:formylglycine-generating enzyme family protein [Treponema sp.]MCL2272006.1 formylglycine-generating enzyme family protein [Treponema sp.]